MCVAVVAVGLVDYATGPRWGLSLFYLMPVAWGAWNLNGRSRYLIASLAALSWFLADAPNYEDLAPTVWNAVTRLVIYVGAAGFLGQIRTQREELNQLLSAETQRARTDPLTDLANRREFTASLELAAAAATRRGTSLTLAYIDLDNFKRLNDHYGHAAGDAALKHTADVLRATLRRTDVAARLGGDEFAFLCSGTSFDHSRLVGERVLERFAELKAQYPEANLGASIGMIWVGHGEGDPEVLLAAADRAMYAAKQLGKGQLVLEALPERVAD